MFSSRSIRRVVITAFVAASAMAGVAAADPPARVARVSYLSGPVSFRPATVDQWASATLNYPLTIGDHIWTDRGSRTELDLGSVFVRLAPDTEFSVVNLDDHLAQLRITQGTLAVRVRELDPDDAIELDTPGGAVSLLRPGFYRIDVAESGEPSTVTVRSGEAEVTAETAAAPVYALQSLSLTSGDAQWSTTAAMPTDDFEDWCLVRDRRVETSVTARYVPPEMIGYADLDQYGQWQQVADYGPVWIPRVSVEWVPYRYGHWVWIDPWGWTWIDDAPWGFAPFHYGRWVRISAGWAWVPGRLVARPVYAPALVAFIGGSGWQASVRIGSEPVAWFPLGPREPFYPAYRVSEVYVQRMNVTQVNVTKMNVTNVTYVNREVPGAVTAVPRDAFVRARPVAQAAVAVPRESVRSAPVAAAAAVTPQLISRVGGERASAVVPPPAAVNRPVVVRHAPPDATRTAVRGRAATTAAPGVAVPPRAQEPPQPPPPATSQSQPPAPARVRERPDAHPQQGSERQGTHAPSAGAAPNQNASLAARQSQERTDLLARQGAERAQLQARHQAEERAAPDAQKRREIQKQHQQEQHAMQERHKQEQEALQKRQEEERRKKGGGA